MLAALENVKREPSVEEMRQRLSSSEAVSAKRFDQLVMDGVVKFNLGGQPKVAACRSIANTPFVSNDMAFQP